MAFKVIQPPTDEPRLAEEGKKLVQAAKELGIMLNVEGFLFSWLSGTRVVVEETDGKINAFALVAVGQRWTHNDSTASVLVMESDRDPADLIEFIKQICAALGATELFIQSRAVERSQNVNRYTVTGYLLG